MLFAALLAFCLLPCAARADQHWLAVSDLHVDPFGSDPQPAGYHTDSNWPLFESALEAMHRAQPDPAVIFITGDLLAHQWPAISRAHGQSPAAAAEQTMQRIAHDFNRRFPRAQFVMVLGNNDDPCGDYQSSPGTPYFAHLARIWAPLVNRRGAAPGFMRDFSSTGAYTAKLPLPSVQAVALDDVSWALLYRGCGRAAADAARAQISMLAQALHSSRAAHSIVVAHLPPGVDPQGTLLTHRLIIVPFLNGYWNAAALSTLGRAKARVAFVLAGHTHRNDFRLFDGVPVLVAPALSPIYDNNPGFLSLSVNADGTLADYSEYAYDEDSGTWGVQSDFKRALSASGFNAVQLTAAHARIERDADVRDRWAAMLMNGSQHREVDRGNWRIFWCAQVDTGRSYAACAGARSRAEILPALAALLAAAVLFGLTLAVLRLARHRRA